MSDDTTQVEQATEQPAIPQPATTEAKPNAEAQALAAFDKGVAEASAPKAEEKPGEPPKVEAQQEAKQEAKTEAKADDKPDPKAAEDAEIKEYALSEKATKRFRELSARPTVEDHEKVKARAAQADEWESVVLSTKATPEQFNSALGYLQAINSGDPGAMNRAYDAMSQELAWLGKQLGREAPGFDPLSAHSDLAKEVQDGELTRARALEIAKQRGEAQRYADVTKRQQGEQAVDGAMQAIGALNAKLKASDPAFDQKLPLLAPTLELIRTTLPPQQWAQAIERAWGRLPAIQAPKPAPPVTAMPLRPTGTNAPLQKKPQNAMEAFEMGLASIRG